MHSKAPLVKKNLKKISIFGLSMLNDTEGIASIASGWCIRELVGYVYAVFHLLL